jgi:hypothetical protein
LFQIFLVVFVSMPPLQFLHRSGMNVSKVWRNPAGQAVGRVIQSSHTHTYTRFTAVHVLGYIYTSEKWAEPNLLYICLLIESQGISSEVLR